jgi:hypothetical protein
VVLYVWRFYLHLNLMEKEVWKHSKLKHTFQPESLVYEGLKFVRIFKGIIGLDWTVGTKIKPKFYCKLVCPCMKR